MRFWANSQSMNLPHPKTYCGLLHLTEWRCSKDLHIGKTVKIVAIEDQFFFSIPLTKKFKKLLESLNSHPTLKFPETNKKNKQFLLYVYPSTYSSLLWIDLLFICNIFNESWKNFTCIIFQHFKFSFKFSKVDALVQIFFATLATTYTFQNPWMGVIVTIITIIKINPIQT